MRAYNAIAHRCWPDQAQDDEERPIHHALQVTGKAHAREGKGLHQPARDEPYNS